MFFFVPQNEITKFQLKRLKKVIHISKNPYLEKF